MSEAEVRDQVFASVRSSFFSTTGLSMGMRRMTAFPYDLLRKTGKSTTTTLDRITRRTPRPPSKSDEASGKPEETNQDKPPV